MHHDLETKRSPSQANNVPSTGSFPCGPFFSCCCCFCLLWLPICCVLGRKPIIIPCWQLLFLFLTFKQSDHRAKRTIYPQQVRFLAVNFLVVFVVVFVCFGFPLLCSTPKTLHYSLLLLLLLLFLCQDDVKE